jgi:hypothetical protein
MFLSRKVSISHNVYRKKESTLIKNTKSLTSSSSQPKLGKKERPKGEDVIQKHVPGKRFNDSKQSVSQKHCISTWSKSCNKGAATLGASPLGELKCIHIQECSGCSLQDGLRQPPQFKEALQFFKDRGIADLKLVGSFCY